MKLNNNFIPSDFKEILAKMMLLNRLTDKTVKDAISEYLVDIKIENKTKKTE